MCYNVDTENKEREDTKMNELLKLVKLLAKADIPFEITPFTLGEYIVSYQVCYPSKKDCVCDAICHKYSYGYEQGLLEIMGLHNNPLDDVEGWLTAEQVFERIRNHYAHC
jgi:hypothetical protein